MFNKMKFLQRFFSKEIQAIENEASNKAINDYIAERENVRNMVEESRLQALLGGAVIAISNEHANPCIGIAVSIEYVSQARNPVLVIKDFIRGHEVLTFGKVFKFSKELLDAFLKLTPQERSLIIYQTTATVDNNISLLSKEEIEHIVNTRVAEEVVGNR